MQNSEIITGEDNKILRKKSVEIDLKKAKKLVLKMKKSIEDIAAMGLAAPQIGENFRVILVKIKDSFVVMINPVITHFSKETEIDEEGCLSLPETWGNVERHKEVIVEYFDEKAKKKSLHLKGMDARVVQHEVDHLEGVLFTDKLVRNKQRQKVLIENP